MRILFAGAIVFLAVWFTLLRPKSGDPTPVTAATPTPATGNVNTGSPAVSTYGKIVQKAKTAEGVESAASAADGADTATATPATGSATGSTAATTTKADAKPAAVAAIPAKVLAALPTDVSAALTARKVLVLGVISDDAKPWRPMADDDRYVRNTLTRVNDYKGDVVVKQVPLGQLATYGPLVNDLRINQTPTIVVIDRDLKADVLTGFYDRVSINQAIADARDRSTSPRLADDFLSQANKVCGNHNVAVDRWSQPTVPGRPAARAAERRAVADFAAYRHSVARLPAPARWRGLKQQWLTELSAGQHQLGALFAALNTTDVTGAVAVLSAGQADARKLDHRFDAVGLTSCSVLRTS